MNTPNEQETYLGKFRFTDIEPARTVTFFGTDGKQTGCFDFGKSPVTFTGDADDAAKKFVDAVIRMWPGAPNDKLRDDDEQPERGPEH